MRRIICSLLLLLLITNLAAQKETNWWHFGNGNGLNFNILGDAVAMDGTVVPNMPLPVTGPITTTEGCFSISDTDGNLIMSGDGVTIWDKNNAQMINGTGLGGGVSSSQSGIVIPVPGSTTNYYAFSVAQDQEPGGIQYAIVDKTMNGGLGGILTKNNSLLSGPTDENIAALRRSNSPNWWIVHRRQNTSTGVTMYVWEVTTSGISLHYKQTHNFAITNQNLVFQGLTKFSSDGTRFVSTNSNGFGIIFGDFDPNTGIPSHVDFLSFNRRCYGIEFSPDGNLIYLAATPGGQIPWTSIRAKKRTDLYDMGSLTNVQLASDGRIYAILRPDKHLYVILNPNNPGAACDLRGFADYLPNKTTFGLPTFPSSFFYAQAEEKKFVCKGNSFNYKVEVSFSGATVDYPDRLEWNWGDGSSSVQPITLGQTSYSLSHNYLIPNNYTITITPYKSNGTALSGIELNANVIDCKLQVNRQIRINVDNASTQSVKK